ncbi:MAG TPA: 50S ribosomal protein L1 [bacterium]|mgnify:CR=1 FL=1|nr:50S ribosomal protein L1 [bacterium]HPN41901.1 50S ribosomal protein L1 [bacterium]
MKHSKRFNELSAKIEKTVAYPLVQAVEKVKATATAKFDEAIEISVRLGVDPRKADQLVRGTVMLPSGTGKTIRILVLTKGEKEKEALEAGADFVGSDEMIEKIQGGWMDFDAVIATPDIMGQVGKLGRVLGPRGLMPNPKIGTVTFEIAKAVKEAKAGKIDFRVDKFGNVQTLVGKGSFTQQQLLDNIRAFMDVINRLKPSSAKGIYIRNITISSTMGPGIKVDKSTISEAA